MTLRRLWIFLFLFSALGASSPCALAQEAATDSQRAASPDQGAMTIGPGDLFDLTVFNVPQLILKVRVDSNGIVSLPLLGDVTLAGMTVRNAQLAIAGKLVDRQM